jgi:hypothetical protein
MTARERSSPHRWPLLALGLATLLGAGACAESRVASPVPPAQPAPPAEPGPTHPEEDEMSEPLSCCDTWEELSSLDGKRVALTGTYQTRFVTKRPGEEERLRAEGKVSRLVAIETAASAVMLGIYYRAEALRPEEEIARFSGQRVRVIGVLNRRTPPMILEGGIEAATMSSPYLDEVESIELVPAPQ